STPFHIRILPPPPPASRLPPYTTLFRSSGDRLLLAHRGRAADAEPFRARAYVVRRRVYHAAEAAKPFRVAAFWRRRRLGHSPRRSEEHTSELQSRENLVCRLLLEKKKNK